ncbi:MAG: Acetyltransferase [Candidatus Ozemobacter sibiricus]|jgi:GNAT superfamily N-acetyltransferase|uniref:Acetyltransferase n=1 Tax=Candidatus Ozemobacter sibiricus TaxID=2268124 RepID=A0A367ZJU6_9BACT|nr:MAG: Acetyltransferase [Candidatus Ozemobacter sibiricus]
MRLRDYRPTDLPYLYEICLKTGHSGQDATALFEDPYLIGQFYAAPYAFFDPRCVLILEGEVPGGIVRPLGYVLGTADTQAFRAWFDREWRPGAAALYPPAPLPASTEAAATTGAAPGAGAPPTVAGGQGGAAGALPPFAWRIRALFHKPFPDEPWIADYPGHLHIDLLPAAQGAGWGRRLMQAFEKRLQVLGCPGYHLGVGARNEPAIAFYRRLGLQELAAPGWGFVFGRKF